MTPIWFSMRVYCQVIKPNVLSLFQASILYVSIKEFFKVYWMFSILWNIIVKYFQLDLVHLGAKYGPCMRWDETIDRQIQDDRNKVIETETNSKYKYNSFIREAFKINWRDFSFNGVWPQNMRIQKIELKMALSSLNVIFHGYFLYTFHKKLSDQQKLQGRF